MSFREVRIFRIAFFSSFIALIFFGSLAPSSAQIFSASPQHGRAYNANDIISSLDVSSAGDIGHGCWAKISFSLGANSDFTQSPRVYLSPRPLLSTTTVRTSWPDAERAPMVSYQDLLSDLVDVNERGEGEFSWQGIRPDTPHVAVVAAYGKDGRIYTRSLAFHTFKRQVDVYFERTRIWDNADAGTSGNGEISLCFGAHVSGQKGLGRDVHGRIMALSSPSWGNGSERETPFHCRLQAPNGEVALRVVGADKDATVPASKVAIGSPTSNPFDAFWSGPHRKQFGPNIWEWQLSTLRLACGRQSSGIFVTARPQNGAPDFEVFGHWVQSYVAPTSGSEAPANGQFPGLERPMVPVRLPGAEVETPQSLIERALPDFQIQGRETDAIAHVQVSPQIHAERPPILIVSESLVPNVSLIVRRGTVPLPIFRGKAFVAVQTSANAGNYAFRVEGLEAGHAYMAVVEQLMPNGDVFRRIATLRTGKLGYNVEITRIQMLSDGVDGPSNWVWGFAVDGRSADDFNTVGAITTSTPFECFWDGAENGQMKSLQDCSALFAPRGTEIHLEAVGVRLDGRITNAEHDPTRLNGDKGRSAAARWWKTDKTVKLDENDEEKPFTLHLKRDGVQWKIEGVVRKLYQSGHRFVFGP